MVKWLAIGPISVNLMDTPLSCNGVSILRCGKDEIAELLGEDIEYWSPVNLSFTSCWLKLNLDVESNESAWEKATKEVELVLESLGLFKSTLSMLAVGGLNVRKIDEGPSPGLGSQFGMENTIVGKPHYFLETAEYNGFRELLTKYREFWHSNNVTVQSPKQLRRLNWAKLHFGKSIQTINAVDRFIHLSIALETLYGEGQHELTYRYSNRAALLLGDNTERRKAVYHDLVKIYEKRSNILHGGISWRIEPIEVLKYTEIIRQTILRCISLYAQGYRSINEILDECMHDPEKHKSFLKDAKMVFGDASKYKEPNMKVQ